MILDGEKYFRDHDDDDMDEDAKKNEKRKTKDNQKRKDKMIVKYTTKLRVEEKKNIRIEQNPMNWERIGCFFLELETFQKLANYHCTSQVDNLKVCKLIFT